MQNGQERKLGLYKKAKTDTKTESKENKRQEQERHIAGEKKEERRKI